MIKKYIYDGVRLFTFFRVLPAVTLLLGISAYSRIEYVFIWYFLFIQITLLALIGINDMARVRIEKMLEDATKECSESLDNLSL